MDSGRFAAMKLVIGAVCSFAILLGGSGLAQASCAKRSMLLILDRSGSMKENNKFDDAKRAIDSVVHKYKEKVQFGLESFSKTPKIEEPLPTQAATIRRTLAAVKIDSSTEMVKAMNLATAHLKAVLAQDPEKDRPTYVLFVTDGKPNPPPCPVAQVRALRKLVINGVARDVKTYVVGFGANVNPQCLNDLAVAGGTALPGSTRYIVASNSKDLADAMNEVVGRTASQEICNAKDDDCDGFVDNAKGSRQDGTLTSNCQTVCGAGTKTCVNGGWTTCSSMPTQDVCDGQDNDCDGQIDNGAVCPNNGYCYKGACVECRQTKDCDKDEHCKQGKCIPKGKPDAGPPIYKDGGSAGDAGGGPVIGCPTCSMDSSAEGSWWFWALLVLLPVGGQLTRRARRR